MIQQSLSLKKYLVVNILDKDFKTAVLKILKKLKKTWRKSIMYEQKWKYRYFT